MVHQQQLFETYDNAISPENLSFTGDDGLFSNYYSKMFKNLEEGGRLIAYFNLSSTDIANLDLRSLKLFLLSLQIHKSIFHI